jgi:hypothetical protein
VALSIASMNRRLQTADETVDGLSGQGSSPTSEERMPTHFLFDAQGRH